MKLNYSKKILILSIITFIIVLTLNLIFSSLLFGKIVDINNKVKQLDISSQERLKELNLKNLIAGTESDRKALDEYFVAPGNSGTVNFTKYLEDLAVAMKVTQTKFLAYEPVNGLESSSFLSAIHYRFKVTGKWTNVFNFLQVVEKIPKAIFLKNISLYYNSDIKDWSADLDFSVVQLK